MTDIEIPYQKDKGKRYRFFEMLPGILSWSVLALPFVLSIVSPRLTVIFIIAYFLLWFVKAIALDIRAVQGWLLMQSHMKLDWRALLKELEAGRAEDTVMPRPAWHLQYIKRWHQHKPAILPSDIYHAIIIATYNESREVLEPTIRSVLDSNYDMKKVILIIAYEERGGPMVEKQAQELVQIYKGDFGHAEAVRHPNGIPGEVKGKGGNITFAGKRLQEYCQKKGIDPKKVVVTTLDSDNRPHRQYLAALTYTYTVAPDPVSVSFQPIPMFTNNIWDAPAPMRVIATGNSFWMVVSALRPHMLRNFSAHAQSLQALIDTKFWSVRTIVEDGHQFWRTYFTYEGRHEVYPLFVPIYQDAVFAGKYTKTLKAQFIQMRRWAWGASDIAYVVETGFFRKNNVPRLDMIAKFLRLLEGHVSWATAPLILAFSAFIPVLFNPQNYAANQLPLIASRIQTLAMLGIVVTLYLGLKSLPPKPARYKSHRSLFMVLQWVYLPVTTICYTSFSGLYSQTRLMFGKYLDKFDVTEKAVKQASGEVITKPH
jgi:cellulose synthase/poly-beta-1,6-N-acetylglucosamine synthase-like glycosyltransferase